MAYYPLLQIPQYGSETTVYNFPPNNWEKSGRDSVFVNITYASEGKWHSHVIDEIAYGCCKTISSNQTSNLSKDSRVSLLSLTKERLPQVTELLPDLPAYETKLPQTRATLGIVSQYTKTTYQGEINPFPAHGSLLSFAPFIQYKKGIRNYFLCINIEKSAQPRIGSLEIYNCEDRSLKGVYEIRNNSINTVTLDDIGLSPGALPVMISRNMSGIPLYFSSFNAGVHLSLEHTHPPASIVTLGERFKVQEFLKNYWFNQCANK